MTSRRLPSALDMPSHANTRGLVPGSSLEAALEPLAAALTPSRPCAVPACRWSERRGCSERPACSCARASSALPPPPQMPRPQPQPARTAAGARPERRDAVRHVPAVDGVGARKPPRLDEPVSPSVVRPQHQSRSSHPLSSPSLPPLPPLARSPSLSPVAGGKHQAAAVVLGFLVESHLHCLGRSPIGVESDDVALARCRVQHVSERAPHTHKGRGERRAREGGGGSALLAHLRLRPGGW